MRRPSHGTLSVLLLLALAASGLGQTAADVVLVEGSHERITFERDVTRVAVGDAERVSSTVIDSRQVLLLGERPGRTTLLVWYEDGDVEQRSLSVQPDLSMLEDALVDLGGDIRVDAAPDRDALVLRGVVADVGVYAAAEQAALAWLEADSGDSSALVGDSGEVMIGAGDTAGRAAVINLLRVEQLPLRADERLRAALADLDVANVTVRRVLNGDMPDDARDMFVLEGEVPSQIDLVRLLHLSLGVLGGADAVEGQLEVVADEGGGLAKAAQSAASGSGGSNQSFQFGGSGGNLFGGGQQTQLGNLLQANIARASLIRGLGGRLLSFVRVSDLPLVRVDVRLVEVNVTRLRGRAADLAVIASDFNTGSLEPPPGAVLAQGDEAQRTGSATPTDVQGVLSFLADGLSGRLQVVGDQLAVDVALQLLESNGLARSLSHPSLTVLAGEQALFQVGGEVPVPQSFATDDLAQGVFNSVAFKSFGVQLSVRPLVDAEGRITLDVSPQVITPDAELTALVRDSTGTDPATTGFETRALRTSARMLDGQSMVMGGLRSRRTEWSRTADPWLSRLWLIGTLFERDSESADEVELVMVLSPSLRREPDERARLWRFADPRAVLHGLVDQAP